MVNACEIMVAVLPCSGVQPHLSACSLSRKRRLSSVLSVKLDSCTIAVHLEHLLFLKLLYEGSKCLNYILRIRDIRVDPLGSQLLGEYRGHVRRDAQDQDIRIDGE